MGERHTTFSGKSTTRSGAVQATAAALICLAGTAGALAQNTPGRTVPQPPPLSAVPQPTATVPGAQPAKPASGKVISQAGKPAKDPMRNPLEGGGGNAAGAAGEKVRVDDNLIVDLHVNDEDLANVLQMLSIQSQKNIISSKNVSAMVTANLYGVTFYEALDAILHVNGYGYIEKGNFIYVYTLDELIKLEEANRQQVWKIIKLSYLNATDAAEFVKPLLSERGQIKTNGKTGAYVVSGTAPTGGEDFAHESTMMVFDFEENLAEIEKVIKEMDTRPAQVLIEATILQTALTEANAFGVDFSVIGDLDFSNFVSLGGPLKAVDGLINGSSTASGGSGGSGGGGGGGGGTPLPADGRGGAIVSSPGKTSGPGTLKLGLVYNDVAAFVRLLDEVSDTTIISRPNILALNRQSAHVLVGRKVGYLNTTSTDTASTQTVEFLDTGTQLAIRPFVSADGMIRMELKPKVSEAVIRNVTDSNGAAVTIPDEISNELTTNVMVRDGQTIVLGGLFREETNSSRRQVPGLGDVPLIGAAFRGHDDSTNRNEIIFMITPTIVNDTVLLEQGKRGEAVVERVRAGSREGLLPWSREKRTQQLVVQATELMRQGKRDQALYKVQRALALNHNQPDAIALREELLNKKANWPGRSLQDDIVRGANPGKTVQSAPRPLPVVAVDMPAPGQSKPTGTNLTIVEEPSDPLDEPGAMEPGFEPVAEPAMDPAGEPSGEPTDAVNPAEFSEPVSDEPVISTGLAAPTGATEPAPEAPAAAANTPNEFNAKQPTASVPATSPAPTAAATQPSTPAVKPGVTKAASTPAPKAPATTSAAPASSRGRFRSVWGLFGSSGSKDTGISSVPTEGSGK